MNTRTSRTAALIAQAKWASARSYMARSNAMSIAGWALLLRRDAAMLRKAPAAEGKGPRLP